MGWFWADATLINGAFVARLEKGTASGVWFVTVKSDGASFSLGQTFATEAEADAAMVAIAAGTYAG